MNARPLVMLALRRNGTNNEFRIVCYSADAAFIQPDPNETIDLQTLRKRAYGYYEILAIPRNSRMTDVKASYLRLAKRYHPDMVRPKNDNEAQEIRDNFDAITEAYTTLIDVTQRHFYDKHGYSCEEFKKKGMPSIFDYTPTYGLYNMVENTGSDVEDWFKAQGHSWDEPKITLRQKIKNAYVEYRWGVYYFKFPWNLKEFVRNWVAFFATTLLVMKAYFEAIKYYNDSLPMNHPLRPIPLNNKYGNDEVRDLLHWLGIRKKAQSSQSAAGLYEHDIRPPKAPSEYEHTLYSNTRSNTKAKNRERHDKVLAERAEKQRLLEIQKVENARKEKERVVEQNRKARARIEERENNQSHSSTSSS